MPPAVNQQPVTSTTDRSIFGAIPARYDSTRLPGKVVLDIAGKPMIQHVYERAAQTPELQRLIVLTDDERVASVVGDFGGEVEMTPSDCASGTDRIAWAARKWDAAAVINIQGDEPLIDPLSIGRLARHLRDHPRDEIATLAAPEKTEILVDPNVVKVVLDRLGYALYFSRAGIPHPRHEGVVPPLRHVGIYGYQMDALLKLATLEPTPLEKAESLEQLRALESGMRIRVLQIERAWWGVDTMEDLQRVDRFLRQRAATELNQSD